MVTNEPSPGRDKEPRGARWHRACTTDTGVVHPAQPLARPRPSAGDKHLLRVYRCAIWARRLKFLCRFPGDTTFTGELGVTPDQHDDVDHALLAYWTARDEAALEQAARGTTDVGGRAGVTSGGHLDRVAQLLARVCRAAGAPADQVFYKAPKDDTFKRDLMQTGCTLPGYYRPTKDWDLVVWADDAPIVVVELKSQNGPSYSNNANNRAEEALGNAVDIHRAYLADLLPVQPWLGYAYVIEDDLDSRIGRGTGDAGFLPKTPHFETWSYQSRIRDLGHLMVEDGLYNAAWTVATSRPNCPDAGKATDAKWTCVQRRRAIKLGQPDWCEHQFGWHELDSDRHGYSWFIEGMTSAIAKHYPGVDTSGDTALSD